MQDEVGQPPGDQGKPPEPTGVPAPGGQPSQSQVLTAGGRQFNSAEELARAYSSLLPEFTKASQQRDAALTLLNEFGLADEGGQEQVNAPQGYENPPPAVAPQAITPAREPSGPYGSTPQVPELPTGEPAVEDRLTAVESVMEEFMFAKGHPNIPPEGVEQVKRFRDQLETHYGVPHRLESAYAEMLMGAARWENAQKAVAAQQQQSQQVQQAARQEQVQASQQAAPVMSGAGTPPGSEAGTPKTWEEAVRSAAASAAEEMAGTGHQ